MVHKLRIPGNHGSCILSGALNQVTIMGYPQQAQA